MSNVEILEKALRLSPEERFLIVEGLLKSLDVPDPNLDQVWAKEAERRLTAYREGRLAAIVRSVRLRPIVVAVDRSLALPPSCVGRSA